MSDLSEGNWTNCRVQEVIFAQSFVQYVIITNLYSFTFSGRCIIPVYECRVNELDNYLVVPSYSRVPCMNSHSGRKRQFRCQTLWSKLSLTVTGSDRDFTWKHLQESARSQTNTDTAAAAARHSDHTHSTYICSIYHRKRTYENATGWCKWWRPGVNSSERSCQQPRRVNDSWTVNTSHTILISTEMYKQCARCLVGGELTRGWG